MGSTGATQWQDRAPVEQPQAHASPNSNFPPRLRKMGRIYPWEEGCVQNLPSQRGEGLAMCGSNASCSLTPQHPSQPGSDRRADHSSRCRPALTGGQQSRGSAAVFGHAELRDTSVARWSCISTHKLPFVTASAQIQAPHPPTLTELVFKSASEPEPPACAVVPSPHAPLRAQRIAPSPSVPGWG